MKLSMYVKMESEMMKKILMGGAGERGIRAGKKTETGKVRAAA